MTPSLLTFAFMSKLIDIPRSGNCYCNTKGVTGDHCEKCDTQNHYFGDPIKGRQPTNISPPKNVKSLQSAPFSPFSDQNLTHFWFSVNLIFQSRSLKTKQLTCLFIIIFFFIWWKKYFCVNCRSPASTIWPSTISSLSISPNRKTRDDISPFASEKNSLWGS